MSNTINMNGILLNTTEHRQYFPKKQFFRPSHRLPSKTRFSNALRTKRCSLSQRLEFLDSFHIRALSNTSSSTSSTTTHLSSLNLNQRKYLPFEEAREYVRALGLKSVEEWQQWKSDGARPKGIPSNPGSVYKYDGWLSHADWLGYGIGKQPAARRDACKAFEDARSFVHTQGLGSQEEWQDWCRQGMRPPDIPSSPDVVYQGNGWESWPDWLGYIPYTEFLPFEEAREYVRSLGFTTMREWEKWCSSGERPKIIPTTPGRTYDGKGWLSYADWLGYGIGARPRSMTRRKFASFEEARSFMHTQSLESQKEWQDWCRQGMRPPDIPATPNHIYKTKGWKSWPDWLGYTSYFDFLPFEEARDYVRGLGLKSTKEWIAWRSSGARPKNIPSDPSRIYKNTGWISSADWMGYDIKR